MPPANTLNLSALDLSEADQQALQQGEVLLTGSDGEYTVQAFVQAPAETVWEVLTAYEQFPDFLPSVVSARVLEQRDNCVLVERKDRRKVGWMPIKVKIITENVETHQERIDYRMIDGTLDSMSGSWQLASMNTRNGQPITLLTQSISATASLGPLQGYFYEVFEKGLIETITELRTEMERRVD